LVAPILLIIAGTLIFFDYRVAGIALAGIVALLALPQWYWMFHRGRSFDFDARTPSGRPVHAKTYLFWGLASLVVAAFGLLAR
jgi:hypothetical protein